MLVWTLWSQAPFWKLKLHVCLYDSPKLTAQVVVWNIRVTECVVKENVDVLVALETLETKLKMRVNQVQDALLIW